MSIPNPYPNIADKEINDVKTWSSAKIVDELQPALDIEITCEETYEGNIITFNNLNNKEITSLECKIIPIQEGTGDPSPSNPRPISGTSTLDIYHSGADTSDYDTISVPLGRTIYGGSAEVVGGAGEETHGVVDLSTLTWTSTGSGTSARWYCSDLVGLIKKPTSASQILDMTMEKFRPINYGVTISNYPDYIAVLSDGRLISYKYDENSPSGLCVYPLITPTDFTFTGQPIDTYLGVNNVWTDADDIKVTTSEAKTIESILKERGILP